MGEGGEARADVRDRTGIDSAGCAQHLGAGKQRGLRHPVEIKPGVELVGSAQPTGLERYLIGQAVGHRAGIRKRPFDVVVHVFGGAGGMQIENMVRSIRGIDDDLGITVVAEETPGGGAGFEVAACEHRHRGAAGAFYHGDVIQQDFAFIEQAENEFLPLAVRTHHARGSHALIGECLPRAVAGLVAGDPGFRNRIVRMGIAQFEGGAATVRRVRPTPAVYVGQLVRRIVGGVQKLDFLTTTGKASRPWTEHHECRGGGRSQPVSGDHTVGTGGESGARGKLIGNAGAEFPTG